MEKRMLTTFYFNVIFKASKLFNTPTYILNQDYALHDLHAEELLQFIKIITLFNSRLSFIK